MRLWLVEKIIVILRNNHYLIKIIFSMKTLTGWLKPNAKRSIPSFTLTRRNNGLLCIKVIKTLTYLPFFLVRWLVLQSHQERFFIQWAHCICLRSNLRHFVPFFRFCYSLLQKNKISCMELCLCKSVCTKVNSYLSSALNDMIAEWLLFKGWYLCPIFY